MELKSMASHARYQTLFEAIADGIYVCDLNDDGSPGRFIQVNKVACAQTGYTSDEMLGMSMGDIVADSDYRLQLFGQALLAGESVQLEQTFVNRQGQRFPVEIHARPVMLEERSAAISLVRNISKRKQAELELQHSNRALATLSMVNHELVHAINEKALLQSICAVIVEQCGYRMAWVGYVQNDAIRSIKIMAENGCEEGYLKRAGIVWADTTRGRGPAGKAARSGQTQISQNILTDESMLPWRVEAATCGYGSSICLPLSRDGHVFGVLSIYSEKADAFTQKKGPLLEQMADDLAFGVQTLRTRQERDRAVKQDREHLNQLQASLHEMVAAVSKMVEVRDPYTAGHQMRVAELAVAIGTRQGLDKNKLEGIRMGGIIHDIGKIHVPMEILSKPGRLSEVEYLIIREHPEIGHEILKGIHFTWPVADIAYQHHERMDGSGYPQGLQGEEICLEARIIAVADVVESMHSSRPYRPGLGPVKALDEIRKNRSILYDTHVVDACLALFAEGFAWKKR